MAPSYWFFWIWWLPLMLAAVAAEEQGQACSAKTCRNLNISYPFWLTAKQTDRPCGSLDFKVTCYNNTPVLRSSIPRTSDIAIIDISYKDTSLRVVDQGKLKSLRASESCHVSEMNTSVKLGLPFRISPANLNLVLYDCPTAAAAVVARRHPVLVEMRCGNQSNMFVRVGGRSGGSENYEGYYLEGCISTFLPVLGTSGEANASDYKQLISDGFLLTWDPPPPPGTVEKKWSSSSSMAAPRRAPSLPSVDHPPSTMPPCAAVCASSLPAYTPHASGARIRGEEREEEGGEGREGGIPQGSTGRRRWRWRQTGPRGSTARRQRRGSTTRWQRGIEAGEQGAGRQRGRTARGQRRRRRTAIGNGERRRRNGAGARRRWGLNRFGE